MIYRLLPNLIFFILCAYKCQLLFLFINIFIGIRLFLMRVINLFYSFSKLVHSNMLLVGIAIIRMTCQQLLTTFKQKVVSKKHERKNIKLIYTINSHLFFELLLIDALQPLKNMVVDSMSCLLSFSYNFMRLFKTYQTYIMLMFNCIVLPMNRCFENLQNGVCFFEFFCFSKLLTIIRKESLIHVTMLQHYSYTRNYIKKS